MNQELSNLSWWKKCENLMKNWKCLMMSMTAFKLKTLHCKKRLFIWKTLIDLMWSKSMNRNQQLVKIMKEVLLRFILCIKTYFLVTWRKNFKQLNKSFQTQNKNRRLFNENLHLWRKNTQILKQLWIDIEWWLKNYLTMFLKEKNWTKF